MTLLEIVVEPTSQRIPPPRPASTEFPEMTLLEIVEEEEAVTRKIPPPPRPAPAEFPEMTLLEIVGE